MPMKTSETLVRNLVMAAFLLLLPVSVSALPEVNPKPFVIPELTSWTGAVGQTTLSGRIVVKNSRLKAIAQILSEDWHALYGRKLTLAHGKARKGDIVMTTNSTSECTAGGSEAYRLKIGDQIVISANGPQGAYWGTRTLLQIGNTGILPRGTAVDAPQYKLRGFMLDCGRKFIPMDYLRQLVRIMGYYKMNVLQIHLNDNAFRQYFDNDWSKTQAAFRLESSTYPGLTARDGSYTKQEFRDLQRFALECGVEIIPEIDAPAHALAFTQYKPEIGSKDYGMDHLDLFSPETYKFMDALWKEYLEGPNPVFTGKRVHIGTDEYSNARQEVVEQFRAFTDHYIRYVEQYGKQAMLWGALTHAKGSTLVKADSVIMGCWYNGYADPKEMKRQGYQLVSIPDGLVYIVPAAGYYHDYLDCQFLYEHWTPAIIGDQTFDECDPAIEGGMFAVWNDHAGNGISVKDIHHRVMPALQTIATKCWTAGLTTLPYAEFDSRRQMLAEAPGVNYLGRLNQSTLASLQQDTLRAGQVLAAEEVGYDYAVSFVVEAEAETKGTVLLCSSTATFYLADPETGQLGFERDGYLNTFNYRLEPGARHTLRIEGDNRSTRLYVDGQLKENLQPETLYAPRPQDYVSHPVEYGSQYSVHVYRPYQKLHYQHTLVFPLRKAGQFKSKVTAFSVQHLSNF